MYIAPLVRQQPAPDQLPLFRRTFYDKGLLIIAVPDVIRNVNVTLQENLDKLGVGMSSQVPTPSTIYRSTEDYAASWSRSSPPADLMPAGEGPSHPYEYQNGGPPAHQPYLMSHPPCPAHHHYQQYETTTSRFGLLSADDAHQLPTYRLPGSLMMRNGSTPMAFEDINDADDRSTPSDQASPSSPPNKFRECSFTSSHSVCV